VYGGASGYGTVYEIFQAAQTLGLGKPATISGVSLAENGNTSGETFTVTFRDTNGLLSVSNSGGATVSTSNGGRTLTISGSVTQVNAALGTLSDTDGTAGPDIITLNATDGFGNTAVKQIPVVVNGFLSRAEAK
jgi:hypothetical protein